MLDYVSGDLLLGDMLDTEASESDRVIPHNALKPSYSVFRDMHITVYVRMFHGTYNYNIFVHII